MVQSSCVVMLNKLCDHQTVSAQVVVVLVVARLR
jgi:hypothetical protein